MPQAAEVAAITRMPPRGRSNRSLTLLACLMLGLATRAGFLLWSDPYAAHQIDEHFLPYEAVSQWEGVSPREMGWPAITTRLVLSGAYGVLFVAQNARAVFSLKVSSFLSATSDWTFKIVEDAHPLYVVGRWTVWTIGACELLAMAWAVRQWAGARVATLAVFLTAISPLAVSYSQFLLADMTGVLFATLILGLIGHPTWPDRPLPAVAGVFLGLAVASKYHFAFWVIPVAIACLMPHPDNAVGSRRMKALIAFVGFFAAALVAMLPWLWLNPLLVAKEFAATVVAKLTPWAVPLQAWDKFRIALADVGGITLVGVIPGVAISIKRLGSRAWPLYGLLLSGAALILSAGQVYDRYGLLLFPVVVLLAALGIQELIDGEPRRWRLVSRTAVLMLSALTVWQLVVSQRNIGKLDSYARAHRWLLANLPAGSRLAVDSLYPHPLPHARDQLLTSARALVDAPAYARKLSVTGVDWRSQAEPFKSAILNDELYRLHWLGVELSGRRREGFWVTLFDREPRFDALSTHEAVRQFLNGLSSPDTGFDALLLNGGGEDLPVKPTRVFDGQPGPTLALYVRSKHSLQNSGG